MWLLLVVVELNPEPSNKESSTLTLSCPLTLSDVWFLLLVVGLNPQPSSQECSTLPLSFITALCLSPDPV